MLYFEKNIEYDFMLRYVDICVKRNVFRIVDFEDVIFVLLGVDNVVLISS